MGNREDLLEGARRAVLARGLAKVTARDIASAAGVSLAAIGYHFGSKDKLVTEAITIGVGSEIGDGMEAAIRDAGEGRTLWESLADTWNGFVEVVHRNRDGILLSTENGIQIARDPEQQVFMAQASAIAHRDIAATVRQSHPELSEDEAAAVGQLLFLLFQGLAVQKLIAPTAELLDGDALRTAVATLRGK
ncbi:TetR/AcrR family transcriptional regulator [Nocardia seriolae]|uniref:TetR/AcrR family transcriptional regulator n=1 Tax=Nocardia seriolae TaxID=37332 RepID=UPI0003F3CCCA|nr:TetR/AcrR family transcriptional regulator [Nocardia seriolae]MTJ63531.1 TetR family transcriptional regulator [Nocardia seriolae]MTJ73967.1 TetR family transcriptional regulator [Nocardia seriolae]MTJ88509.1 TetR family transcriptional regulator [Nocardia seriolae]MTK32492.1 TetR family transcriptional regulator [Nocardia seriolae]MTK41429.1 TetR family transcriptional regulator [Nocardia seriolae]